MLTWETAPSPSSDKEGCTVLEVYCTVGCACKNSYTIQHSQAVTSFLDFESISKPNIRLTFQYLAAFSIYSAWFFCFQFSVCQFTVFSFLSVWMPFLTVYCWVLLDLHLAQGLGWHVSCWFNNLLCVSLFIFLFCIFSKWCEMKLNILWNIC